MNYNKGTIIKHRAVFDAWLDGAEIQFKDSNDEWLTTTPSWLINTNYRIKPKEPEVYYLNVYDNKLLGYLHNSREDANEASRVKTSRIFKCVEILPDEH